MLKSTESKILFLLLIAMAILYIVKPESGSKKELEKEKKSSLHRIDSIHTLYIGAMKRVNKLEIEVKEAHLETVTAQKARDIAHRQTQIARNKYENIRKLNYTNAQLDSMLIVLYPH